MINPFESQGRTLRLGKSCGAERSNLSTHANMSTDAHPKSANATKTNLGFLSTMDYKSFACADLKWKNRGSSLETSCAEKAHPLEQTRSCSRCGPTKDHVDVGDNQGTWYFMQRPTQTAITRQNEEDWHIDSPFKVPVAGLLAALIWALYNFGSTIVQLELAHLWQLFLKGMLCKKSTDFQIPGMLQNDDLSCILMAA